MNPNICKNWFGLEKSSKNSNLKPVEKIQKHNSELIP